MFQFIKDRIRERIDGWLERNLSKAGKEILIKSVLQAIPSYAMSCFRLPDQLITDIRSLMSKFWWGSSSSERKIHWASWPRMSRSKAVGGVGFRDLKAFNVALLGKQAWRILTQPHSLLSRIYKAKYFPNYDLFSSIVGYRPSQAWRSIWEGIDLLRLGCRKHIVSGVTTSICYDPWIPKAESFYIQNPGSIPPFLSKVSDLIDVDSAWWNLNLLEQYFEPADIDIIKKIPLGHGGGPDRWVWHFTKSGTYSVRSAYLFAVENPASQLYHNLSDDIIREDKQFWKRLWSLRVPKRAQHFAWRFSMDSLPTASNLRKRTMSASTICPLCSEEQDSSSHLFFTCNYAHDIWIYTGLWPFIQQYLGSRGDCCFRKLIRNNDDSVSEMVIMACDSIWFQRNRAFFEGEFRNAREVAASITQSLLKFQMAQGWSDTPSHALLPRHLRQPPVGFPLVFFYAGLTSDAAVLGVVAWNAAGLFHRAICRRIPNVFYSNLAEAMAFKEAILFASELGFQEANFVGDALQIIGMVEGYTDISLGCHETITSIQSMLQTGSFNGVYWVPRDENYVAHHIANFAKSSVLDFNSWTSWPSFLSNDSGRFPEP